MTLNKQRILSELGSVVNQLQSADCGCMGKLFGNTPQNMNCMSNSYPQQMGYGHGCHATPHHGHGCYTHSPYCGEPYSMNAPQATPRPYTCMGQCNAPKLYADTYNYLNDNLMQPVVKEVYNDLRSLTPANTIMNNELGNKMGLAQGQVQNPNLNNNIQAMDTYNQIQSVGQSNQAITPNQQYFGGMGPQIVNMLRGEVTNKPIQPQQGLLEPMVIDAPQSPHGKVGVTPLRPLDSTNYNTNYSANDNRLNNLNQQPVYAANVPNTPSNPMQQSPLAQQPSYGQHSQGMKKFNDIFPGVMQGLGGDLGFDPMAIAIQMNPANQQQVAMNTMQKMLNNNQSISKILEPNSQVSNANTIQNAPPPSRNTEPSARNLQNPIQDNQLVTNQQPNTVLPVQNQQVYYNPATQTSMQQPQSLIQQNTENPNLEIIREDSGNARTYTQPQMPQRMEQNAPQPIIKEPIFPVDTTKQKIYHNLNNKKYSEPAYFNTLGQPVEKLPAHMYQKAIPPLPQTLSPQPVRAKYSNVKPTQSKTALMGEIPTEKTPSRSQLQQIYKQYKGSHSYTKQNVTTPAIESPTHSERRLNVKQETRPKIPLEKVGGDTSNNQPLQNIDPVKFDHVGDVPVPNKPTDLRQDKDMSANHRKGRNGLQDMVYTSYPTSAAWTFHGDGQGPQYPCTRGRRYNRY